MTFERTHNTPLIDALLTNPRVWRMMSDNEPHRFTSGIAPANCMFVLVREDEGLILGMFLLVNLAPAVAEVHICLLPAAWGKRSQIAREFIEWLWRESSINELTALIPSDKPILHRLALSVGFQQRIVCEEQGVRGGNWYDITVMTIRRPA